MDLALRDPQVLLLRTADGVLTTVEVFLNGRYGYEVRCEVVGEHGTLALTEPTVMIVDSDRAAGYDYPADWRPAVRRGLPGSVAGVGRLDRRRRRSPLASARDGLVATVIAQAMITSMRDGGRWVAVEPPALG